MGGSAPTMSKSEREYRDEDDHRTMSRAAEIECDSSRMQGVKRHHSKMTKALGKVGRKLSGSRSR